MAIIINRDDAPRHLFNIPELDFSEDLFSERLIGPWFRLGSLTINTRRDDRRVEDVVERQSILLKPKHFAIIFDELELVGNVLSNMGNPQGSVFNTGKQEKYRFTPFHRFDFNFAKVTGEPLVFFRTDNSQLFINPDILLFFELEEKSSGIWWDPRRGVEAIRQRVIDQGNLEIVEIGVEYLRKYLQARQMSLLIGHYHHLHLFDPPQDAITKFVVTEDVVLGSPEYGAKAILQNWGLRKEITSIPFLQRRLHLWFEIKPAKINIEDPWTDEPSFDIYKFTLPTQVGLVAPGCWANFRSIKGRKFKGYTCDYLDPIYFRQEVLTKYESASNFEVADNGSVSCGYWGLNRSTRRIGNELLATAIGDFAKGVPFEEWAHWKQYAVEPPSPETAKALNQEQTIPDVVNNLVYTLNELNSTFLSMAYRFNVSITEPLWNGSLDSIAGRQMKWVYPSTAHDDEFLKRATLLSTLIIDELKIASIRELLIVFGKNLHRDFNKNSKPLGSRNLLQRLTFITILIKELRPDIAEIPNLVRQAENKAVNLYGPDLRYEIDSLYQNVRDEFAPLVFLYDLRTHGGVAHNANRNEVAMAAGQLGLPKENWHQTNYLHLLKLVTDCIDKISNHFTKFLNND